MSTDKNEHTNSKLFSRRDCLKGSAAGLFSMLAGCGGDTVDPISPEAIIQDNIVSDDGMTGGEEASKAAELAFDRENAKASQQLGMRIIPYETSTRRVYQVEIVSKNAPGWNVGGLNLTPVTPQASGESSQFSHIVYAIFDNTPTYVSDKPGDRASIMERMYLAAFKNGDYIYCGFSNLPDPRAKRYIYNYYGNNEVEWLFAISGDVSPTNWNIAVRFFELPQAERGSRKAALISNVQHSRDFQVLDVSDGDANSYRSGNFSQSRVADAGESILLLSHRTFGHYEKFHPLLLPCKGGVDSEIFNKYRARRVLRHLQRVAATHTGESGYKILAEETRCSQIGFIRSDAIQKLVDKALANASSTADLNDDGFDDFADQFVGYDTTDLDAQVTGGVRQLEDDDQADVSPAVKPGLGRGVSVTCTAQAQGKIEFVEAQKVLACRVSIPIVKVSLIKLIVDGKLQRVEKKYRIKNYKTEGMKVGFVGIFGRLTIDEEITNVFRNFLNPNNDIAKEPAVLKRAETFIKNGGFLWEVEITTDVFYKRIDGKLKRRVQGVTIDVVFDFPRGTIVQWLLEKIHNRLDGFFSDRVPDYDTLVTKVSSSVDSGIVNGFKGFPYAYAIGWIGFAAIQWLANFVKTNGASYATFEFSPLRFAIANEDASSSYTGGFRVGFQGEPLLFYTPGVKYIGGVGLSGQFTKSGNVAKGFVRLVTVVDLHFITGNKPRMREFVQTVQVT